MKAVVVLKPFQANDLKIGERDGKVEQAINVNLSMESQSNKALCACSFYELHYILLVEFKIEFYIMEIYKNI
jgi:hypothetical protein